ncbi:MAG: hydrolase [bacterium]
MLQMNKAALVLIDIQGKLATLMHKKEQFYENCVKMIQGAKTLGLPILWNEQIPDKLGPTIDEIKTALGDGTPLVKKTFSCCGNPDFVRELEKLNRKQVLLIGMETHVCVWQTAQDLLQNGYEVYLISDAVSSRSKENKRIGLQAMTGAGAKISSVEMALFEMLQQAEGDQFRQCIKIIK